MIFPADAQRHRLSKRHARLSIHPVSADAPRRCSRFCCQRSITPKGLGRAADSVPLSAGGHMSPHLSSEDFCPRFASGMAEPLLISWISPLILLAKKNFSDFFTVSLFHANRSPFHDVLDGASQRLLQMRMSAQPVEHPFLQCRIEALNGIFRHPGDYRLRTLAAV